MQDLHATQELYHQLSKDYRLKLQALEPFPQQEIAKQEYQRTKEVWEEAGKEVGELTERVKRLAGEVKQKLDTLNPGNQG